MSRCRLCRILDDMLLQYPDFNASNTAPFTGKPVLITHFLYKFTTNTFIERTFSTCVGCVFNGTARKFLLSGKQDKKKHQQFVRRWQKRLLGDSEPIGAHVDPYDPTSPVRIAPEEQGEYEEVLDDDAIDKEPSGLSDLPIHKKRGRLHVGSEQWQKERFQIALAREFEKLTLRTYTPLSLDMANDIEKMTGTWYTLKDENLLMAQTIHNVTGRPYTAYNFGLRGKINDSNELRRRFAQAVVEVYTLKQAGLDMDISKLGNCGVYDQPSWIKNVKLVQTQKEELALVFPMSKSADQLLQAMRTVPAWESSQPVEEEELAIEEVTDSSKPVQDSPPPTMDPDTPEFKRAALVKTDSDKKPFDFMSNRPVSRSKPVEKAKTAEAVLPERSGSQSSATTSKSRSLADLTSDIESSRAALSQIRHDVFEYQTQRFINITQALSESVKENSPTSAIEELKWHNIPLNSISVKFALFKRLFQLTGIRISDPQITSASTLGDLYGFLCANAKPKPTSLYSTIHIEGQKARERAKRQQPPDEDLLSPLATTTRKRKADLGDLIKLGNVDIRSVKPTKQELRDEIGLGKVIRYALVERGLVGPSSSKAYWKAKRKGRIMQEA